MPIGLATKANKNKRILKDLFIDETSQLFQKWFHFVFILKMNLVMDHVTCKMFKL